MYEHYNAPGAIKPARAFVKTGRSKTVYVYNNALGHGVGKYSGFYRGGHSAGRAPNDLLRARSPQCLPIHLAPHYGPVMSGAVPLCARSRINKYRDY